MEIIFNPHSLAKAKQSSLLAMLPSGQSGLTNSHIIPAAGSPANLHKSIYESQ